MKERALLIAMLSIFTVFTVGACNEDESDPSMWIKKLNTTQEDRDYALNKLEFIYEVDTVLQETCSKLLDKGWRQEHKAEVKAMGAKFDKYVKFCNKYKTHLDKKIPRFRKEVIPALLEAYNTHPEDGWNVDKILKLLIRFQDTAHPIAAKQIQDLFIKIIEQFGMSRDYFAKREKIDDRTVVAIRGLAELNEFQPHPRTMKVISSLIKKIYKDPKRYDFGSKVRMEIVKRMPSLIGKGSHVNKSFKEQAADILVDILEHGETDTARYLCKGQPCKQSFLVNKKAAVALGDLGVVNKKVNFALVTCLYSVDIKRRGNSFRECKAGLSKVYTPELKGTEADPVGVLELLAEGDPARFPLTYDSKKDLWYVYKDAQGNFVLYGSDPHQSADRSKSIKDCMANYDKFRNSNWFRYITKARYLMEKGRSVTPKTIAAVKGDSFDAYFAKVVQEHKKRTKMWGEPACHVFELNANPKSGKQWDELDSAVIERTAMVALRSMGAKEALQQLLINNFSKEVLEAYWDFTAREYKKAGLAKCKKDGIPASDCVPKYDNRYNMGIKAQWNRLKDYNWLVDSSREAMYGAGWMTTDTSKGLGKKVEDELLRRLTWLHDQRSCVMAAQSLSMLPYKHSNFVRLIEVAKNESWWIATELLWEQFRQQTIQNIMKGNPEVWEKVQVAFQSYSFNESRWKYSQYLWLPYLQDYFGYWPVDPKTKKPKRMSAKQRDKEFKKYVELCKKHEEAWNKAKHKGNAEMPPCKGYDDSKPYDWDVKNSPAAKAMSKAAHISKREAEKRLLLAGYERIRLQFLEAAFDYAQASDFDFLKNIKPEDIMADPGEEPLVAKKKAKKGHLDATDEGNYELVVRRPWDDKMEAKRRKHAVRIIRRELKKLYKPIDELKTFLAKYKGLQGDTDFGNIATLRDIATLTSVRRPCPAKNKKGHRPMCAVAGAKLEGGFWYITREIVKDGKKITKKEKIMETVPTPWKARRKALWMIVTWPDRSSVSETDRQDLVKALAEAYGNSEVKVREAIILALDTWAKAEDYKTIAPIIKKVVDEETAAHRRGGYYWQNQEALCFLARLKARK